MAFDFGFDFRYTLAFVTDPSYAKIVIAEIYPHTYTNGDGLSINAGWVSAPSDYNNTLNTVDARLAGYNVAANGTRQFKVDLSSGSAPGAGDYTADLAAGRANFAGSYDTVKVIDDTTDRISFGPVTTASGEFYDASGTKRTPGTDSWDLVRQTAAVTFASTTALFQVGVASGNAYAAHFRLTKQEAGGPEAPTRRLIVRGA